MNRLEALYNATDVRTVLGDREVPFDVLKAEVSEDGARVTVNHRTDLEPLSMTGEARRTNGESDGRLLFDAFQQAVGTQEALTAIYIGDDVHQDTGEVELRSTFGRDGEVFSAVAPTAAEAVGLTFKAVSVHET